MNLHERTGFASKDRPWLKWHESTACYDYEDYNNFYEYFKHQTAVYGDGNICLMEYNGVQMFRNDVITEVDLRAKQLNCAGISHGDIVSLMMLNTPEVIILLLALSKIGAICNLIKYDETPDRVNEMLCLTSSKYLFVAQLPFLIQTASAVTRLNSNLNKIVYVPLMPNAEPVEDGFVSYLDFFNSIDTTNENSFERTNYNDTCVIVYTGGTTGTSKGIELTHRNVMAMTYGLKHSNYGFVFGKRSMNILPPAVAYYLNATVGLMVCGVSVLFIPFFQIEDYPNLVAQTRPNVIYSGPILLKSMEKSNIADFSYLTNPVSGGDKLYPAEEIEINEGLAKKGCLSPIQQGYGESEVSAVATCNPQGHAVIGSIGIPMQNVLLSIFEHGTDIELPYGKDAIGEICISGPTLMKGYYKDPDATNQVLRLHSDGQYWIHTDDLGKIDNDGFIFHCGRAKRMLTRSGNKVWMSTIETEASELDFVVECCAVKMNDPDEREVPVLHMIVKDGTAIGRELVNLIDDRIIKKCSEQYIPKYYIVRKSIPYTETNKKMDYRALEKEDIFGDDYSINADRLIIHNSML